MDDVIVGHGISLLQWRSGGVKHFHDMLPSRFPPSSTFGDNSSEWLETALSVSAIFKAMRMRPLCRLILTSSGKSCTRQGKLLEMMKPSIFIGSAKEGLPVARALEKALRRNARVDVRLWDRL